MSYDHGARPGFVMIIKFWTVLIAPIWRISMKIWERLMSSCQTQLTHCGLAMSYGIIDLGLNWSRILAYGLVPII